MSGTHYLEELKACTTANLEIPETSSVKKALLIFLMATSLSMDLKVDPSFEERYKIDQQLLSLKDGIGIADTLIIYRHRTYQSTHADAEYGYGFAYLFSDTGAYRKAFTCLNKCDTLHEEPWIPLSANSEFNNLMQNAMRRVDQALKEPHSSSSYEGYHDVAIYLGPQLRYEKHLAEFHLLENRLCHDQAKFIYALRDSSKMPVPSLPRILQWTYTGSDEPDIKVPAAKRDSCSGIRDSVEHIYMRKRFLRRDQVYYWRNNQWQLAD